MTVGDLRRLQPGTKVVAWYAKDDDPRDVRISYIEYVLIAREVRAQPAGSVVARGGNTIRWSASECLELTFRSIDGDDDVLDIEIGSHYRDSDEGVSLAGRGRCYFYATETR